MTEPEFDAATVRQKLRDPDEEARRRALADVPDGWTPGALSVLVEALGDASWRVRKDAAARIARWPDRDGAIPLLIATLSDDANVGLRNAAVETLALIGAASVGALVTALAAGGEQRKFLVDALGAIGDPAAVPALGRAIRDDDENVRAAAAEALGAIGGDEAIAALRQRLQGDGDYLGRLAALEALTRLRAVVTRSELEPLLEEPILRHAVLEALGHAGDLAALPHLLAALDDRSRAAREGAQVALVALHEAQIHAEGRTRLETSVRAATAGAVNGIVAALSSDPSKVRRAAATLLGWGRWAPALARLVDALLDEEVHATAARAIVAYGASAVGPLTELAAEAGQELKGEIFALFPRLGAAAADARVGQVLTRALDDEDATTAAVAARTLGDVGGKDALGPLFQALEREDDVATAAAQTLARLGARHDDEVRLLLGARGLGGSVGRHLCRVLAAIGGPESLPPLLGALRGDDASLRRASAEALGQIAGRLADGADRQAAREALVIALADEDLAARQAAAEALGVLGDPAALPALMTSAQGDEELVRAAAVKALGQLADPRAGALLRELLAAPGAVATHAAAAVARLPADAANDEALAGALAHRDPEVVKAAVRALAPRAAAHAHALAQAIDHPRWDVRRLSAQALSVRAADPAIARVLEARLRVESDALVREALEAALGQGG
jgi:HEAT repeat protein